MSMRRLVVSADDLGASPEVNAAVAEAHARGILTNASLMTTGDAAPEAVRLVREHPALGVGLHLVLAQGRPAAAPERIPGMVGADGHFRDTPVRTGLRYAWLWLHRAGYRQLRTEIEAQLDAFARTGLPLSHVDGHLNMHLHPMVLPILLDLAPRYGIRAMRLTREGLGAALRHDRRHLVRKTFEGSVFGALARWAGPRLAAAGIVAPDRVYGMHQTGAVDESYLMALLADLPAGTSEVYGHPALGRSSAMARHQPGYRNREELAALVSEAVRDEVRRRGVELVSYHALAR